MIIKLKLHHKTYHENTFQQKMNKHEKRSSQMFYYRYPNISSQTEKKESTLGEKRREYKRNMKKKSTI